MQKMKCTAATILLLLSLAACRKGGDAAAAVDEGREAVAEDQKIVGESIREGDHHEALAWLGDANHMMFKGDKQVAADLTQKLLDAGAVSVEIIGVEKIESREIADVLAVTLPPKGPKRTAVFAVYIECLKGSEYTPVPDLGQDYLRVSFD